MCGYRERIAAFVEVDSPLTTKLVRIIRRKPEALSTERRGLADRLVVVLKPL